MVGKNIDPSELAAAPVQLMGEGQTEGQQVNTTELPHTTSSDELNIGEEIENHGVVLREKETPTREDTSGKNSEDQGDTLDQTQGFSEAGQNELSDGPTTVFETQQGNEPQKIPSGEQEDVQMSLNRGDRGEAQNPSQQNLSEKTSTTNSPHTTPQAQNALQVNSDVSLNGQQLMQTQQVRHASREGDVLLPTHLELRVLRSSVRLKRKMDLQVSGPPRPPKPSRKSSNPKPIEVAQNSAGLVEVQIQYDHAAALAMGLGVTQMDIQQAVREDNQERQTILQAQPAEAEATHHEAYTSAAESSAQPVEIEGIPIFGDNMDEFFDPCPEDEMDTDMDEE